MIAQSWRFFMVFANFRHFWVTLRRSRRRAVWNFYLKPSLMHNNNPCTLYTSSTAPGMLQGVSSAFPHFAYFQKCQKWRFPKFRKLWSRISRKVNEIARWTWGDSESSDDYLSWLLSPFFSQMLPSSWKMRLKLVHFCAKYALSDVTSWRHSDVIIRSKNVFLVPNW